MIVLDTNVVSAVIRRAPEASVVAWLDRQAEADIWITTITVFEARAGLLRIPEGRRRAELEAAFLRLIHEDLDGRILTFDAASAEQAAQLAADRHRRGSNIDFRDTAIAGIAIDRGATLATRNRRDFADLPVPVVDPWTA
ncbi:MAG: type II toxin-antitoxin system VapC family toxin [Alphaproteobacteria bacterium]|nr:type II toxin-antitoxin system VapC family toxin [Alphaproteobacteria bacterium]